MSPPAPAHRSLRVTLLLDGQAAGERLLPLDAPVSVGPRPQDTFSIAHLDASVCVTAGDERLDLRGIIGGRVVRAAGTVQLATLWRPDGHLPLLPDDQVFATLSERVAVAMERSAQPPEAAPLPGRFRPRLLDEGSGLWLGSLAVWSAIATALLVIAWQQEPITGVTLDDIPDRVVEVLLNLPPADNPTPPPEVAPKPQTAPRTVEDLLVDPGGSGLSWGRSELARRSEIIRRLAEQEALLQIQGYPSDEQAEQIRQIFATDLSSFDDQLDDSVGGPRGLSGGEMGDGRIGPLEQLGGDTATAALVNNTGDINDRVAVPEASLAALLALDPPPDRRGPPSAQIHSAMKSHYHRHVRHCFEVGLKTNPNLAGRITLALDIEAGRVTRAVISESTARSEEMETCLLRRARGWRFAEDVSELVEMPFSLN